MRLLRILPLVACAMLVAPAAAEADFMHTVMPGESLTSIAAVDGLTVAQLAAANGISPFTRLVAGSTLAIPPQGGSASTTAQSSFMHTVMPGESLTSIAAADGLTVAQLAAANGISPFTRLIAGSTLAIPHRGAPASTARAPTRSTSTCDGDADADDVGCSNAAAAPTSSGGSYLVRRGDTLTGIAGRAGTTVSALAALNGLNPKKYLLYGTVLRLPAGSTTPASSMAIAASAVASTEPVGPAAVGSLKAPPYPTPQRVTAGQVGSIAAANGVPPPFAAAIGWQESGFQNGVVSPVGARGVMQILPGTWNWIGQDLNRGGTPLAPASALDNVRGGVIMLHALLGATGGNEAETAAGYYQGLSSVQQHGMFSSTKQYVRDVMALTQRFGGG
ncbi:MAG: LysM peptidoglycan-binding domain-containing protein [Solirubrobacterales bacterium]|nr:LysM peptidoglycan-binding domain-containing protein [Solirubrobacterales bacterium]MBV9166982.1 LysM peptidoglycan-binding domain-containing protein [Solirubrobacterales bacterium]